MVASLGLIGAVLGLVGAAFGANWLVGLGVLLLLLGFFAASSLTFSVGWWVVIGLLLLFLAFRKK